MLPVATALAPMAGASLAVAGTAGTLAGLRRLGGYLSALGEGG